MAFVAGFGQGKDGRQRGWAFAPVCRQPLQASEGGNPFNHIPEPKAFLRIAGDRPCFSHRHAGFKGWRGCPKSRDSAAKRMEEDMRGRARKRNEVLDAPRARGIAGNDCNGLAGNGIQLARSRPDGDCWICARCRTVRLYPSMGICTFCGNRLEAKPKASGIGASFYLSRSDASRLRREELNGQADAQDRIGRQAGFLGMSLDKGAMKLNAADLLPVATTM